MTDLKVNNCNLSELSSKLSLDGIWEPSVFLLQKNNVMYILRCIFTGVAFCQTGP